MARGTHKTRSGNKVKTKEQLVKTALKSEVGFKLAVIDLLADIRNSIITAIVLDETETEELIDKAIKEMKRVITEESKEEGEKSVR